MMKQKDRAFLDQIITERMENIQATAQASYSPEDQQRDDQLEAAFQASLSMLPQENADLLKEYVDQVFMSGADQYRFFYCAGVKDGIRLLLLMRDLIREVG